MKSVFTKLEEIVSEAKEKKNRFISKTPEDFEQNLIQGNKQRKQAAKYLGTVTKDTIGTILHPINSIKGNIQASKHGYNPIFGHKKSKSEAKEIKGKNKMSILTKEDRKDIVWAVRTSLLEKVNSGVLTEGKKAAAKNFIINEATYQQLLNLAFNPERETNIKSVEVLEKVAMEEYAKVLAESEKKALWKTKMGTKNPKTPKAVRK